MSRRTEFCVADALRNLSPSLTATRPLMPLTTFCLESTGSANVTGNSIETVATPEIVRLKLTFRIIMISISVIGVAGNVLNLLTLRSPSLRTVPFRYIRALAVYDLISLTAILAHFLLEIARLDAGPFIYYKVWVEDVVINSFLIAGLYIAVLFTIERYLLIQKPHKSNRLIDIEHTTSLKIVLALVASLLLHMPMTLQNAIKLDTTTGRLVKGNNQWLLCREPYWTIFNYYKMFREFLRFFCVVLLISLNIIIAKSLQIAKKNRRMLIKRASQPDLSYSGTDIMPIPTHHHVVAHLQPKADAISSDKFAVGAESVGSVMNNIRQKWKRRLRRRASVVKSGTSAQNSISCVVRSGAVPPSPAGQPVREKSNKRDLNLLKSFMKKKLTVLMGAICLIYVIGNVPQMVVMIVQNESLNDTYGFQVFRNVANTLEVLNHCLNFFIFCMASSEYTRAFLLNNCAIVRCCLFGVPCIERFLNTRRANSLFSLFDQYDLQSMISEGGAVINCKTDSVVALRKHAVTTVSTCNLTTTDGAQMIANGEFVRRKSASVCLLASSVLDAAVIEICQTPLASSLCESSQFLSQIQPRQHYFGGKAQPRTSVCVSLLSGDKMSLSSLSGGVSQPTYRDNKLPQMRPIAAVVTTRAAVACRSPSVYGSAGRLYSATVQDDPSDLSIKSDFDAVLTTKRSTDGAVRARHDSRWFGNTMKEWGNSGSRDNINPYKPLDGTPNSRPNLQIT